MGALSGYSVLDISDKKGALCTRLLADMGAELIHLSFEDQGRLHGLVPGADIFIETFPPGYLDSLGLGYDDLSKINPGLIMVSITPFGQGGPYKDFKASDLTLQALGGWLSVTGELDSPLKLSGNQACFTASLYAANGIVLALWCRHVIGRGQYIDISIFECVAGALDHVLPRYFNQGVVSGRQGSRHWNNAFRVFPCKDGFVLLSLFLHWETLVEWLASEDMAADLTDVKWRDNEARTKGLDRIVKVLETWTLSHTADELVEKGQLMHFPWAKVMKPDGWQNEQ